MKNLHTGEARRHRAIEFGPTIDASPGSRFTAAAFINEAGTIIAICLGLAVLMRLSLG